MVQLECKLVQQLNGKIDIKFCVLRYQNFYLASTRVTELFLVNIEQIFNVKMCFKSVAQEYFSGNNSINIQFLLENVFFEKMQSVISILSAIQQRFYTQWFLPKLTKRRRYHI